MKLRLSALALGATMLVGCASSGEQTGRSDPLEGFNRSMYNFNYNVLDPDRKSTRLWFARWQWHGAIMFPSPRVTG